MANKEVAADARRQTVASKMLSTVQTTPGEDLKHVHFITEDAAIRVSQATEPANVRVSARDAKEMRKSREQLRQTPSFV